MIIIEYHRFQSVDGTVCFNLSNETTRACMHTSHLTVNMETIFFYLFLIIIMINHKDDWHH